MDILDVLPHRPPFIMVDKIVETGPTWVKGYKLITWNEWFISETTPYMPCSLIIEALAQMIAFISLEEKGIAFLSTLKNFEMHSLARPGDRLDLYFEMTKRRKGYFLGRGTATVEDRVVVKGEEIVAFMQS
ncbi:3-hydroxyacyl-ACP dehydratase FabZ family protein [Paenibacillus elgii]